MDFSGLLSRAKICSFQLLLWVCEAKCTENVMPTILSEQMGRSIFTSHHKRHYICVSSFIKTILFSAIYWTATKLNLCSAVCDHKNQGFTFSSGYSWTMNDNDHNMLPSVTLTSSSLSESWNFLILSDSVFLKLKFVTTDAEPDTKKWKFFCLA